MRRARREYRLIIVRPEVGTEVLSLFCHRNVWNYARTLKAYWRRVSGPDARGVVEVREVTDWRPL